MILTTIISFILGGCFGFVFMALMVAAKNSDERNENND